MSARRSPSAAGGRWRRSKSSGDQPEVEPARAVAVEAAAAQVPARRAARVRFEQQLLVERDGGLDHRDETIAAPAVLGCHRGVVSEGDARPRREPLDRVDEVEVLDLSHEGDGVTARVATEALVAAEVGSHVERRRLLGVERAQPTPALPDPLQCEVLTDQRDEISGVAHACDVVVDDAHG